MIKGIAHICLLSTDINKSEHFYLTVLGFRKKFNFIKNNQICGFYLEGSNGVFIEIFKSDIINYIEKSPIAHFCMEVTDIDSAIENLRKHNISVSDKELGQDYSWQCWFKDPDGTDIEFHQYTEKSCQYTCEDCYL